MSPTLHHRSPAQRGSIILEGLIAILLFSVGILAIVGMQAAAIKNSSDAKYRATASYLASQIIGQMWADRSNLAAYAHRPSGGACSPTGSDSSNANVASWVAAVASAVPGAVSSRQQIVVTASGVVTVTVCWQAPQDSVQHNFVATAQILG